MLIPCRQPSCNTVYCIWDYTPHTKEEENICYTFKPNVLSTKNLERKNKYILDVQNGFNITVTRDKFAIPNNHCHFTTR